MSTNQETLLMSCNDNRETHILYMTLTRRKILRKKGWLEMTDFCFVVDINNKPLAPTKVNKGWFLIRKQRAELVSKYPMVIRLKKEVKDDPEDESYFVCGIDDGSKHVGIAVVQKCKTKNKVVFKGTIALRQDVKKLMETRKGYRNLRRSHKRYRKARFSNRATSRRKGRIAPSIKQKRQSILRVVNRLNKWVNIQEYHLEDVMIDIRAMTDGYKPYRWQYQKSNRLDENIRKAVIIRDGCKCMECGKPNTMLEVHHIRARRYNGSNTLGNLITLCSKCHQNTEGHEEDFEDRYFNMINGKSIRLDYAQHVMQGKTYLRSELSKLGSLMLTNGGATANKRIDWNIDKSHSNDAIVITGLRPNTCDVKEWGIKPIRRQSKAKTDNVMGFRHRDLVSYTYKNGETHTGYITSLCLAVNSVSFQSKTKQCKKVRANKCTLLWRYNRIYWL